MSTADSPTVCRERVEQADQETRRSGWVMLILPLLSVGAAGWQMWPLIVSTITNFHF